MRSNTTHLPPAVLESLAAEGGAVVTPNRRLAVALKRAYDTAQQQAGRRAWAAPDILPLATFFARTHHIIGLCAEPAAARLANTPRLIEAPQSHLLWEQVIRKSDVSTELLSVPQTAKQAAAAWSVANQWRILDAMRSYPLHEDGQVFFAWALSYQQLCREMGVIDHVVLPDVLANVLALMPANTALRDKLTNGLLPNKLLTAGFDIITPQVEAFFKACSASGIAVRPLFDGGNAVTAVASNAATVVANTKRVVFATEEDEFRACAAWARTRLESKGGPPDAVSNPARIAIVVPDLQNKRSRLLRVLTDALDPVARVQTNSGTDMQSASVLFNVSLGLPLNEYGLVNDALELIEFAQGRPLPFARVSTVLRSPFIGGAEQEMAARAKLDAQLRDTLSAEVSLLALQKSFKLNSSKRLDNVARQCPVWMEIIDRVVAISTETATQTNKNVARASRRSPHDWSRHFTKVLGAWGFPGERALGSTDFQTLAKFRDCLDMLAALENVQPRMRADEALVALRRIVADTVFQPESVDGNQAPIQVLGILESAGQSFDPFDAMWVTGLSDDAWPLAARPNPFIPAALQRRAGVTEASAAASLALDKRITDGWLHSARELIVSHSMYPHGSSGSRDGQAARPASALISHFALHYASPTMANYAEALQTINALHPRSAIPDAMLPPLPTPTAVSGGSSIIRDQAACPFRAFARHRLSAKPLAEPAAGLDAATRGTLLHRVLSIVWLKLKSQATLLAMGADATSTLIGDSVYQAIAEVHADGAEMLVGRFAAIEHARLCAVVTAWLAVERERLPFDVVACEEARRVEVAGLLMRLQLDRLDRLQDGTHALIDYKTGVAQVKSWIGERPDEPQLPLYFHTAEQEISAMVFARLKRGKTFGFEGVSVTDNVLPNVTPIEHKRGMQERGYVSWDALIEEWEVALQNLAKQFVSGIATVDPKNGGLTCAQCDLQSVCRVAEFTGVASEVDDTAGAADE
ncbi:MAG: PD-(D/E)XK nuclease family protein [Rhodocyclaceae bacterium]|nr:PD-(D/E)XK nuclease family protein [Rhodocyclaceae bacterium]MCA3078349.1 PD-(D/E)XK nuclease family protein [Rhodocyclaceae bacterium]